MAGWKSREIKVGAATSDLTKERKNFAEPRLISPDRAGKASTMPGAAKIMLVSEDYSREKCKSVRPLTIDSAGTSNEESVCIDFLLLRNPDP